MFRKLNIYELSNTIIALLSLSIVILSRKINHINQDQFYFIPSFLILLVLILFISQKISNIKISKYQYVTLLALFTISCFSLNENINIFQRFPWWVEFSLACMHISLMLRYTINKHNDLYVLFNAIFLGLGLFICLYCTIYLAPIMPISLIGILFLGLGIHTFIPIFILISLFNNYIKIIKQGFLRTIFWSTFGIPLFCSFMIAYSNSKIDKISEKIIEQDVFENANDIPLWVKYVQKLEPNMLVYNRMAEGILFVNGNAFWENNLMSNSRIENVKINNPIRGIGSWLSFNKSEIDEDDKIKILKTTFNTRHLTEEKLWSGKNLETSQLLTQIQIYPQLRLAYYEQNIFIKNTSNYEDLQNEALYSFYLPPGAIATTMSLWINGKEEISRLTTRNKADKAYKTIVGVENRDPSLMHWQDGNRITVNVFPCTNKEIRRLKVGFTVPMHFKNNIITLNPIYFDGPVFNKNETININIMNNEKPINYPKGSEIYGNRFQFSSKDLDWKIEFKNTSIATNSFMFKKEWYSIKDNTEKIDQNHLDKKNWLIDIHQKFELNEIEQLLEKNPNKNFYCFENYNLEKINKSNFKSLFNSLKNNKIQLNQIYLLDSTFGIISKNSGINMYFSDLKETPYYEKCTAFLSQKDIFFPVISLSEQVDGFYQSLLSISKCEIKNNIDFDISKVYFRGKNANSDLVYIDQNNTKIVRNQTKDSTLKTDHAYRLFAFQKMMENQAYFNDTNDIVRFDKNIELAINAHVVSPMSSLIALETIHDYERFGIEKNENGLSNATNSGKGAVPEPHEWALILLGILFLCYVKWKL